jgi:hypothetical protein
LTDKKKGLTGAENLGTCIRYSGGGEAEESEEMNVEKLVRSPKKKKKKKV